MQHIWLLCKKWQLNNQIMLYVEMPSGDSWNLAPVFQATYDYSSGAWITYQIIMGHKNELIATNALKFTGFLGGQCNPEIKTNTEEAIQALKKVMYYQKKQFCRIKWQAKEDLFRAENNWTFSNRQKYVYTCTHRKTNAKDFRSNFMGNYFHSALEICHSTKGVTIQLFIVSSL